MRSRTGGNMQRIYVIVGYNDMHVSLHYKDTGSVAELFPYGRDRTIILVTAKDKDECDDTFKAALLDEMFAKDIRIEMVEDVEAQKGFFYE